MTITVLTYPDLAVPLRDAIVGSSAMDSMPSFNGNDNVYTRRPIPVDAPFPVIVIGPDISTLDRGGLNDQRLSIMRDIAIYGVNDTAADYRVTELVARAVRDLFHRNRLAITVSGWRVVNITARGPMELSVDNPDKDVARNVELTIELVAAMA